MRITEVKMKDLNMTGKGRKERSAKRHRPTRASSPQQRLGVLSLEAFRDRQSTLHARDIPSLYVLIHSLDSNSPMCLHQAAVRHMLVLGLGLPIR